jgi:hypothetical protein
MFDITWTIQIPALDRLVDYLQRQNAAQGALDDAAARLNAATDKLSAARSATTQKERNEDGTATDQRR